MVAKSPSRRGAELRALAPAIALMVSLVCACTESVSLPVRAAQMEQNQCEGTANAQDGLQALETLTVLSAEPQVHIATCSGAGQVFGVKLVVRPRAGESADQLARTLQCHKARAILGRHDSSRLADDPFWLPSSWVTIQVKPDAGNLLVTLGGDTVTDNLRILHRATAFAAQHGPR